MILAGFLFAPISDKIGRKATLLTVAIPYSVSMVLTAVAENIYVFYLARLLMGLGEACIFSTLPSYIGEIATPKVRGFWGNVPVCFSLFGQLFINAVGGYSNIKTAAWISLVAPILFVATFSFAPESPYYYIMKSRKEEARKVLERLRGCKNVDEELAEIEIAVQRQLSETCTWKELITNESNRRGLIAATFLRTSQMLSGIACFASYIQYIFRQSAGNVSAVNSALIYNVLMLVTTIGSIPFIDKLGRRMVVMVSLAGCGLSLICISTYFYIEQKSSISTNNVRWVPLASVIFYIELFSFGLATVPTLMLGELFSAKAKSKALSALLVVMGFWVSVTTKLFQLLDSNFGIYTPFAFFAVCCFCSLLIAFYIVPETKGKTLEEIQLSFKKKNGTKVFIE